MLRSGLTTDFQYDVRNVWGRCFCAEKVGKHVFSSGGKGQHQHFSAKKPCLYDILPNHPTIKSNQTYSMTGRVRRAGGGLGARVQDNYQLLRRTFQYETHREKITFLCVNQQTLLLTFGTQITHCHQFFPSRPSTSSKDTWAPSSG